MIKAIYCKILNEYKIHAAVAQKAKNYAKKFEKQAFRGKKCESYNQYEAVITRWYHTIEKGLAYIEYRAGFGKKNIDYLLLSMENYVKDGYDQSALFFQTALSTLDAYIDKNKKYGIDTSILENRVAQFSNKHNQLGGTICFEPVSLDEIQQLGYKEFITSRHSMRHFANEPIELERVKCAIELAQHTPSACNRQGWRSIIIENKEILSKVLANQNGNEGFGHEFDKLILVVTDTQYFNIDRELFQPFIDGGMYAQSLLNALHYYGIASVPLSASLNPSQEKNVRKYLQLKESEMLIMFIGIGAYPEKCQTTRSERRKAAITVF